MDTGTDIYFCKIMNINMNISIFLYIHIYLMLLVLFHNSSNDIWCLNLDSYYWHKQTTSNLKPQPRYGQSQIELGKKHLLVLGRHS